MNGLEKIKADLRNKSSKQVPKQAMVQTLGGARLKADAEARTRTEENARGKDLEEARLKTKDEAAQMKVTEAARLQANKKARARSVLASALNPRKSFKYKEEEKAREKRNDQTRLEINEAARSETGRGVQQKTKLIFANVMDLSSPNSSAGGVSSTQVGTDEQTAVKTCF